MSNPKFQEENNVDKVRWGVLGAGSIARQFADGLRGLPEAELLAVGSRTAASADAFADEFDVSRRYPSYKELASDSDVDVVYVATPHVFHAENAALCLEHGKAVLCEKPFTVNARQAERLVGLAREKGLFLMEGMWTRFFPLMGRVRDLLSDGTIGEARMLTVDFGFRTEPDPASRLFDPSLGGGALLDVGVYCAALSSMVFGPPTEVTGLSHLGETGVDEQFATVLKHDGGRLSVLAAAIRTNTPHKATIMGTEGRIEIHPPWWRPETLTLTRTGHEDETIRAPYTGNGFAHEAEEVMDCLRSGKLESAVMPLDETVAICRVLDELRGQWGLRYPSEQRSDV